MNNPGATDGAILKPRKPKEPGYNQQVIASRRTRSLGIAIAVCASFALGGANSFGCTKKFDGAPAPTIAVHVKLKTSRLSVQLKQLSVHRPLFESTALFAGAANWYRFDLPLGELLPGLVELNASPDVVTAFVPPVPQLAATRRVSRSSSTDAESCPIATPSYSPYQGYLGVAPAGINAPAAWLKAGGRGHNVWFADVEGGWNAAHEDLPGDRIEHIAGEVRTDRNWVAHGTAVLGEVIARDNGIGMTGIAPETERIFTASIGRLSAAEAIAEAAARLRPGDVLLIELHAIGPRGRFLPMEFWDDVFDVIKATTDRGVVVIEAAGNGGENLSHKAYKRKLDRSKRDSGAIMVGAGAPARPGFVDRSRLDFSNYGPRVDVQGWGRRVATLDYWDLQDCSERLSESGSSRSRNYTDEFSGTSSASPIIAGAALLLQSIAKEHGEPLTPKQLRKHLVATGSPQVDGPHGKRKQHIGPRPDLRAAVDSLNVARAATLLLDQREPTGSF